MAAKIIYKDTDSVYVDLSKLEEIKDWSKKVFTSEEALDWYLDCMSLTMKNSSTNTGLSKKREALAGKKAEYQQKYSGFKLKKNVNYTYADLQLVMDETNVSENKAIEKLDLFLGDAIGAIINLQTN